MAAKKKDRPGDRQKTRTSDESELVRLSRDLSNGKPREAGAILNHATLSVWAATFILCSVLVFGLYQVRGRLDGIQAALEQSEQDKKLLLEGMDELLTRAEHPDQLLARAEPPDQEAEAPPPPKQKEQDETEESKPNDLARKYKIYYRAKDGEDLAQISEKFNVSEDQLRLWNALKATDSLIPGQVVVINKSTQPDKPVVVAKAPSPPDTEREENTEKPAAEEPQPRRPVTDDPPRAETKGEDAAAEETPVGRPDAPEGTGDSLAAGREVPAPEAPEDLSDEPFDETLHVVKAGESLSSIGQEYGVSWLDLATLNGIEPPGTIYVGQRLSIPRGSETSEASLPTAEVTHKVQRGENLYRIGRLYDLSWKQIAQANGISDPSQLHEGQVLKIPVARGGPEL
jgi:LysM repeat protein